MLHRLLVFRPVFLICLVCAAASGAEPSRVDPRGGSAPAARTDFYGDPLPSEAVARMGKKRPCPAGANLGRMATVALSPDGKFVVTGGQHWTDRTVRLWDAATGRELWKVEGQDQINCVAISPDGKTVAWGREGPGGGVRLAPTDPEGKPFQLPKDGGEVSHVVFSPDGKTLAATSAWTKIQLWNLAERKLVREIEGDPGDFVHLAYSPDGKLLAASGDGGVVRLWDVSTGKEVARFSAGEEAAEVYSVAFSPDGKVLATAAERDDFIRLSDAATGKELRRIKRCVAANSLVGRGDEPAIFSPDGRTVVSADAWKGAIYLYETASGECRHVFKGHLAGVVQVAISADGRLLASASDDGTALLWDLSGPAPAGNGGTSINELDVLWDDLASPDARTAYRAVRALSAGGVAATALLRAKLRPSPPVEAKRLKKLMDDLNDDDFDAREAASAGLARLGELAASALQPATKEGAPAETRWRARELLDRLSDERPTLERLRTIRATEALERMNTVEARDVLKSLAEGAPEVRLTREAKTALVRLTKRAARP